LGKEDLFSVQGTENLGQVRASLERARPLKTPGGVLVLRGQSLVNGLQPRERICEEENTGGAIIASPAKNRN